MDLPFFDQFKDTPQMKREDGSSRFAFVTFLMMNDSYLASALMMAYGLRAQQSQADIVCMVTKEISEDARYALNVIYDHVVEVDLFFVPHKERKGREDRPLWFTRLNSLRMGPDGDLGLNYEKICILDADVYPIRYFDNLFTLRAPAGMINETKANCLEYDENGKYVYPESLKTEGKWNWHKMYEKDCAHGMRIPQEVTDRVIHDTVNLGLNGSIYVFDTSMKELESIREDVQKPEIQKYVGDLFKWPDMQYFTMRWSGEWTSLDIKFSSFNGYPNLDLLCGCHYSGFKPWYFNKKGLKGYVDHEDFQFWYDKYLEMATERYPKMLNNTVLANLAKKITRLKAGEDVIAVNKKRRSKKKK